MKLASCGGIVVGLICALTACGGDDGGDGGGGQSGGGADASSGRDGGGAGEGARDGGARADGGERDGAIDPPPAQTRVCSADGFCWELPTPQGETLRAAWAAAPNDVWAVGDGGLVLHYDGEAFRREAILTTQDLLAVHGSSASDVWVAGETGAMLHYDGSAWSMQDLTMLIDASGGAMTGVLHGVFAAAPDAVWAVGHSGVAAVIAHYDGERWSNQQLGVQTVEPLHAVWGTSAERVWAVGDQGRILGFDGAQWNVEVSATRAALRSVHALTDHDVWAVGADRSAVHWDGMRWQLANEGLTGNLLGVRVDIDTAPPSGDAGMAMPDPAPMPADAGADAGPPQPPEGPWLVWAFGEGGRVFRYNGTVWAELPSGSELALHGAARVAVGELIAVGERGQITRFEGDALQSLSGGSRRNHLALWGDGDTLWVVGDEIARRDRSGVWSALERPSDRSLYGAWGDDDGLWAVGTAGTIVRWQDGELHALEATAARDRFLRSVWGAGDSLWIVGHGGLALVRAAGGFLEVDTRVNTNLLDVWGDADDSFWAVGEAGTVLRWDGIAWLPVPTSPMIGGVTQNLRAVWGSSAEDVWVVGTESTILHWDGARFESLSRGESYSLNDVWGRGADDVYAVGTGGIALHYDGSAFRELETGTQSSLQSVFGDDGGRVFAAGLDGVVLVREP
jgi:hypothetical protein